MKQATALIFRLLCLSWFLYQVWIISVDYLQMETFSQTKFARMEDFPVPLICVTTKDFNYDGFNSSLNITHDDYADGKWNFDGYSVQEIWDFLSPDIAELMSGIKIENKTTKDADKYRLVEISLSNLNKSGFEILGRV